MRKIFCVLLFLILITLTVFNGYSADIDGVDNGYEWDGATPYVMIDGESNCGIDFAIMKIILDNENNAVYFCFMLRDRSLDTDNLLTGVSFSVENSDPFILLQGLLLSIMMLISSASMGQYLLMSTTVQRVKCV